MPDGLNISLNDGCIVNNGCIVVNTSMVDRQVERYHPCNHWSQRNCRDLGRDVSSVSEDENELLYARSRIVNTSRAAGIQAIDTPFLGLLVDREAFLRQMRLAMRLGFKGKQCVHPSQIEPVNELFSPSQDEVARAKRVVDAFEEAQARGLAAISFEGKMVDIMAYRQAKDVIAMGQVIDERRERMAHLESSVPISEVFAGT